MSKPLNLEFLAEQLDGRLLLTIVEHRPRSQKRWWYAVESLASSWGQAARFHNLFPEEAGGMRLEAYDVLSNGHGSRCECVGWLRHGGKCKHLLALEYLCSKSQLEKMHHD